MAVTTKTQYYDLDKYWRGHPIRDTDIAVNMDIIDSVMELNRVAVVDSSTSGAGYYFDGVDDDVSHAADQAGVDFDADDDFYIEMVIMPEDVTRTTDYLINKETGGVGYGLYINEDDLYIRIDDNATDASAIIGTAVFANGVKAHVLVSFDRSGDATAYIDGESVGTVDISAVTATIASAGVMHIGNDSAGTNEFAGEIYLARIGNTVQTASEALALSNGSPIPRKYFGASQTLIVPSDDCSGDSTGNWTDVNGSLAHSASLYTYTVTTGASVASFTDEAELVVGKRYLATALVKDGTGAGATVRINALTNADAVIANGTSITVAAGFAKVSVEWIATETNNKVQLEIVAASVSDGETVIFDTIECNSLGCVMQLDPDGIGHTMWIDKSGNDLHVTVTGAAALNLPPNHIERYVDLSISADSTFTVPAGYKITSIIVKETAGNSITGGLDVGLADGDEDVVSAEAVAGSATVDCTLVQTFFSTTDDDVIYVNDHTDWNSAVIEFRASMVRVVM